MPHHPMFSVIVTAYNYGRFIEESIDSILSQEYPSDSIEIIIVDDGSMDDTPERVKKYGTRIRYLRGANRGQAYALNLGYTSAKGEIVAPLDADDYWFPDKMRRIVEEFEKNPEVGMIYHPFEEFDDQTGERRRPYFRPVSGHYFGTDPDFFWYQCPGTSTAYRRTVLQPLLPIPEQIRMLADGYIDALLPLYSRVLALPEYLAAYRFHGNNSFYADEREMPAETRQKKLDMWQVLINAIRKGFVDRGFNPERPPLKQFFVRLELRQQGDGFKLKHPGRVRYLRHLLLYNRYYGPHFSARLRWINYFNAFGSLVTGYRYFYLLDQWRQHFTSALRPAFQRKT